MTRTLFDNNKCEKTYDKVKGLKKPVLQMKNGVVVARYDSIGDAGRATNILRTSISDVCRGKNKKTGGFEWKYAEFDIPPKQKHVRKNIYKIVISNLNCGENDVKQMVDAIRENINTGTENIKIIKTKK